MTEGKTERDKWPLGKGIAWAGFWLGLGLYFAADAIATAIK